MVIMCMKNLPHKKNTSVSEARENDWKFISKKFQKHANFLLSVPQYMLCDKYENICAF